MAKKRVPIPKRVEREVLFRNQSVCCVCQKNGVQIHHIDRNPSNNNLTNLCVLCIEHHAQASTVGTMTKGLDAGLLRKYKSEWEGLILRRRRQGQLSTHKKETSIDRSSLRFEIKRTALNIPGTTSKADLNRSLDYLYNWSLIEGFHADIVEALGQIHWLCNEWQIKELASRIYELFWHFVGPTRVPMNAKDEKEIIGGIELLGDLGGHVAILGLNSEVMKVVVDSLLHFDEIAGWYKRSNLKQSVSKGLNAIEKDCQNSLGHPDNKKATKTKLQKSLRHVQGGITIIKKRIANPTLPDW